MSLDALLARMTEDAQARIAAVRAAADGEIAALSAATEQALSRNRERTLDARRSARQRSFDIERAEAQHRAAVRLLTAQHALLDRVFARAQERCANACSDPRYRATLERQVPAVLHFLGDRPATLRCAPQIASSVRALLPEAANVQVSADDTLSSGFIAEAQDATCTIDCSLPARLAALRPQLEAGLLARVQR